MKIKKFNQYQKIQENNINDVLESYYDTDEYEILTKNIKKQIKESLNEYIEYNNIKLSSDLNSDIKIGAILKKLYEDYFGKK